MEDAGERSAGSSIGRVREAPDARLFVNSVDKALKVLGAFDGQDRRMPIADIARRSGIGRSAAQRFVYTLTWLGYLDRDPQSRHYGLSPKLFDLLRGVDRAPGWLRVGYPALVRLQADTDETVSWVELDGHEIMIAASLPSARDPAVVLPVGQRYPAMTSSSGQVLLSRAPLDQLLGMLRQLDPAVRERFGDRDTEEILALFSRAQRQGYSLTEKNLDQGTLSISAPVLDRGGHVVAAINLSMPATRHDVADAYRSLVPLVVKAAGAVTAAAAFTG